MLVDEEDGNILTLCKRLKSILNRRYLRFWGLGLVGEQGAQTDGPHWRRR